jgi:hypothetical protein
LYSLLYSSFRAQDIDRSSASPTLFQQLRIAKRYQDTIVTALEAVLTGLKEQLRVSAEIHDTREALDAEFHLAEARAKKALLGEKERLMLEVGYFSEVDSAKSKEELGAQLKEMNDYRRAVLEWLRLTKDRFNVGEVRRDEIDRVEVAIAEAQQKIALLEQRIKAAPGAAELKNATVGLDTLELVRTNLIRFGGVAIILFLASVLVPIYRYNVRLGTYYLARADALILCRDAKVDNFGEMINILTPALEFDKEPKTPIDSASVIIKEAAAAAKRSSHS